MRRHASEEQARIETTQIDAWLEAYRQAWSSGDRTQIAALFTDGIRYFTAPYGAPLVGIERVTEYWLAQEESALPWTFEYEVVARQDDLFVVRAVTSYPQGTLGALGSEEFHNLWLVTLDGEGRARVRRVLHARGVTAGSAHCRRVP